MGIRVLADGEDRQALLYDGTTGEPVRTSLFYDCDFFESASAAAEDFIERVGDPLRLPDAQLQIERGLWEADVQDRLRESEDDTRRERLAEVDDGRMARQMDEIERQRA